MNILDLLLHTDQFLSQTSLLMGNWIYALLFMIVFCETGLVVTPFLPGDSMLFALGAMTTLDQGALDIGLLSVILFVAALLGDNLNYAIGRKLGQTLFENKSSRVFKKKHLLSAQKFYERWGSRAIVLARFVPIVRTFVPFVAGIGKMKYRHFLAFSVLGAILWIQLFLWAGRIFGNLPAIKTNFHIVIFGVIGLSLLPILIGYLRLRKEGSAERVSS
jgi:membrane-associated protein